MKLNSIIIVLFATLFVFSTIVPCYVIFVKRFVKARLLGYIFLLTDFTLWRQWRNRIRITSCEITVNYHINDEHNYILYL